jgi:hypothetical protein
MLKGSDQSGKKRSLRQGRSQPRPLRGKRLSVSKLCDHHRPRLDLYKAQTVTLAVAAYRGYASIDWRALSAAAITSILPMLIFAVLALRQIVGGLSLGAVK